MRGEEGIVATTCGAAQLHKQTQWGRSEVVTYVLLLGHFVGIDGESWWVEKRNFQRKELLVVWLFDVENSKSRGLKAEGG